MPVYFYVEFMGTYSDEEERGIRLRGLYPKHRISPIIGRFEELFGE